MGNLFVTHLRTDYRISQFPTSRHLVVPPAMEGNTIQRLSMVRPNSVPTVNPHSHGQVRELSRQHENSLGSPCRAGRICHCKKFVNFFPLAVCRPSGAWRRCAVRCSLGLVAFARGGVPVSVCLLSLAPYIPNAHEPQKTAMIFKKS